MLTRPEVAACAVRPAFCTALPKSVGPRAINLPPINPQFEKLQPSRGGKRGAS